MKYLEPHEYDSIRNVLGVTTADVDDDLIESLPFGPHAENLLDAAVAGVGELYLGNPLADPPVIAVAATVETIKLAVIYATAALIAEQYGRGGFISNVSPTSRNVTADAALLWSYFSTYKNVLIGDVSITSELTELSGMILRGPTRTRDADRPRWLWHSAPWLG